MILYMKSPIVNGQPTLSNHVFQTPGVDEVGFIWVPCSPLLSRKILDDNGPREFMVEINKKICHERWYYLGSFRC